MYLLDIYVPLGQAVNVKKNVVKIFFAGVLS